MQDLAHMTLEELKALIGSVVDEKLQTRLSTLSKREAEALWQSMLEHLIKRQPGDPSTLDLIRQDRER